MKISLKSMISFNPSTISGISPSIVKADHYGKTKVT